MLIKIISVVALAALFFVLSWSADLIVTHIKKIGEKLGIKIFLLGMILGIMTSFPEMIIGINSIVNKIPTISFGNLTGAIIVLFSLILSINIILNRKINTERDSRSFLLILFMLFSPFLLALDSSLNYIDGIILVVFYLSTIIFLYKKNKTINLPSLELINKKEVIRHIFFIVLGIIILIISAQLIIKTTIFILKDYNISPFIVGLLFYSIGTNLPELTIAIKSFKRKTEDLSFSNLIGSALGNVLMLGILSLIQTINVKVDISYLFLTIFSFIFFIVLYIFYKTDHLLNKKEGFALLGFYLVFLLGQIFIQINY